MNLDRKDSHLDLSLQGNVDFHSESSNGFQNYRFEHDALPEISYDAIDLKCQIAGKTLHAPLLIGAMTGGTTKAKEINSRLAQVAAHFQIGMSLGSQRKLLTSDDALASYQVKQSQPSLPLLFGNLGAVQLNDGISDLSIRTVIEKTQCDAFYFHLNPLQEAIQPEGNRDFSGLLGRLSKVIPELGVPVFVKEVGAGISERTALKLKDLPLSGIETGGMGGTSWAKIESLRGTDRARALAGERLSRWGIPTAESVVACHKVLPHLELIASGGIRSGLEIAKAIALGADAAALALPILKEVEKSVEDGIQWIESILIELRCVLFITGMANLLELRKNGPAVLRRLREK